MVACGILRAHGYGTFGVVLDLDVPAKAASGRHFLVMMAQWCERVCY
jgi:hypothetical protein